MLLSVQAAQGALFFKKRVLTFETSGDAAVVLSEDFL